MPAEPRLLVLGGEGQLGRALAAEAPARVLAAGRAAADVTDAGSIGAAIDAARPDVVVNAAAFTQVDRAEDERAACFAVNRDGAGLVAAACAARRLPLIHLSTDYVFSGTKGAPYAEEDEVAPVNAYGASKAEGEALVAARCERHVVLRTAWLFGAEGHSFVRTILRAALAGRRLRVVADQHGSPTPAPALARIIVAIADRLADGAGRYGIVHAAGVPHATWHALAEAVVAIGLPPGHRPSVTPIATAEYPTAAARPADTRLACARLADAYGLAAPDWRRGLPRVVAALGLSECAAAAPRRAAG